MSGKVRGIKTSWFLRLSLADKKRDRGIPGHDNLDFLRRRPEPLKKRFRTLLPRLLLLVAGLTAKLLVLVFPNLLPSFFNYARHTLCLSTGSHRILSGAVRDHHQMFDRGPRNQPFLGELISEQRKILTQPGLENQRLCSSSARGRTRISPGRRRCSLSRACLSISKGSVRSAATRWLRSATRS